MNCTNVLDLNLTNIKRTAKDLPHGRLQTVEMLSCQNSGEFWRKRKT